MLKLQYDFFKDYINCPKCNLPFSKFGLDKHLRHRHNSSLRKEFNTKVSQWKKQLLSLTNEEKQEIINLNNFQSLNQISENKKIHIEVLRMIFKEKNIKIKKNNGQIIIFE